MVSYAKDCVSLLVIYSVAEYINKRRQISSDTLEVRNS